MRVKTSPGYVVRESVLTRKPLLTLVLGTIRTFALLAASTGSAHAEDAGSSLLTRPSLTDTPDGPKEALRRVGVTTDVWVTQFYQGQTEGDGRAGRGSKTWRYGGKVDGFLKLDPEKFGLWPGLHINAQYEHYLGENINDRDFAISPVNAAQAYVQADRYHSVLSANITQDFGEHVSVSAGKYNMLTLASQTPLVGGGGIDTFMNRALAAPSTGIGVTSAWRVAE